VIAGVRFPVALRSARGVLPTDAGAAFYGRARDILAELDGIIRGL